MKKVDFRQLSHYISKYEDPYGTVEIMKVGYNLIVKFYNGGWSENEYLDRLIRKRYSNNVIVHNHPVMILRFFLYPNYYENLELLSYEERDEFRYEIKIEK